MNSTQTTHISLSLHDELLHPYKSKCFCDVCGTNRYEIDLTVPACKSTLSRGYDKLALIMRPHIDRTEEKRRNKDAR